MNVDAVTNPPDLSWTIVDRGHTPHGAPWFVVRKKGGQTVRITVAAAQATPEGAYTAIEHAVRSLQARPGRGAI